MKLLINKIATSTLVYELYQYSTHFCIKIFQANNSIPVKVHVGSKRYINNLWKGLSK